MSEWIRPFSCPYIFNLRIPHILEQVLCLLPRGCISCGMKDVRPLVEVGCDYSYTFNLPNGFATVLNRVRGEECCRNAPPDAEFNSGWVSIHPGASVTFRNVGLQRGRQVLLLSNRD